MNDLLEEQSDADFMREALRQARKAFEAEEVPVGAAVVRAGKVIARACNQVELLKDATAHAEMLGCADERGGAAGSVVNLLQMPTLNHRCDITTGVLRDECAALLQSFFRARRAG
jgi:tRNA(adenine34) deaminase